MSLFIHTQVSCKLIPGGSQCPCWGHVLGLWIQVVLVARVVFLLELPHTNISLFSKSTAVSTLVLCSTTDPGLCQSALKGSNKSLFSWSPELCRVICR